ncbi:hypothetical protein CEP51_007637 [Fusarium floridanum]|uniref:Inner membrane component domain-containing protein n=1 Tax=Fusarium floridanum TaxID=1325733 RepID=A0A428RNQ0_9HYPO|nr:hypothetical protein CEP51_007637 [Fusarium floridanum]
MPRRVSTTLPVPRRDSLFSADDDTAEVEADAFRRRLVNRRKSAPPGFVPSEHHYVGHHPAPSGIPRLELTEAPPDELPAQDDAEVESDAGSFTLKLRQQAINETHPFGIRLWKPALYQQDGPPDHDESIPDQKANLWALLFNILWTTLFGWWLAVLTAVGGLVCMACPTSGSREYGQVLCSLARYIIYPFGKLVRLEDGENLNRGRSMHEYEQWQNGSLNRGHLFFGPRQGQHTGQSTMFGRGQWNVIFHLVLNVFILPPLFLVSIIFWALVFTIPMAKTYARSTPSDEEQEPRVLLCTYSAVGFRYWRYSRGGNSIFLIELMGIALIIIFNWLILQKLLHIHTFTLPPGLLFPASLLGIIPLAYFIGKAVASISAQSSMGVSAVVNAFFSTIFEVLFYCVALKQGKSRLVEG